MASPCPTVWLVGTEKTPKRRMSAALRRTQIIESARQVFGENGFAATRIRDIAARAGVNEAMIYRHFPSKEDLFEACVLEVFDDALASVRHSIDAFRLGLSGSDRQIDLAIRDFMTRLARIAVDIGPLIGATAFGPEAPVRQKLIERITALFDVAAEVAETGLRGRFRDGVDPHLSLEMAFGGLWFAASNAAWSGRELNVSTTIDQLVSWIYVGLMTPPDA